VRARARAGRPEDLLLCVLPVPPVAIRPSVEMDGASNEDDVTMKIMVRCARAGAAVCVCGGGGAARAGLVSPPLRQPDGCAAVRACCDHACCGRARAHRRQAAFACVHTRLGLTTRRLAAPTTRARVRAFAWQQIIDVNNLLRELLARGNPAPNMMENWDFLQVGWRWGTLGGCVCVCVRMVVVRVCFAACCVCKAGWLPDPWRPLSNIATRQRAPTTRPALFCMHCHTISGHDPRAPPRTRVCCCPHTHTRTPQVQAAMLINADLPGVTLSKDAPTRPMRCVPACVGVRAHACVWSVCLRVV
jgi:hypothetical protein